MKHNVDHRTIYSTVRDLHLLIDSIPKYSPTHSSEIIYENVTSLTLIANKTFSESSLIHYLSLILNFREIRSLIIQFDRCSNDFLRYLIGKCSKLKTLIISSYRSWSQLVDLSSILAKSSIRSLTVHELLTNLTSYKNLQELFDSLEIISITVP